MVVVVVVVAAAEAATLTVAVLAFIPFLLLLQKVFHLQKFQKPRHSINHLLRPRSHAQHSHGPARNLRPARVPHDQGTEALAPRRLPQG